MPNKIVRGRRGRPTGSYYRGDSEALKKIADERVRDPEVSLRSVIAKIGKLESYNRLLRQYNANESHLLAEARQRAAPKTERFEPEAKARQPNPAVKFLAELNDPASQMFKMMTAAAVNERMLRAAVGDFDRQRKLAQQILGSSQMQAAIISAGRLEDKYRSMAEMARRFDPLMYNRKVRE